MENKKHLDLISAIVLAGLSIYVIIDGVRMTEKANVGNLLSPGLMPIVLGGALLLCSVFLFLQSIKGVGVAGQLRNVGVWFREFMGDKLSRSTLVGLVILGVYTYLLLGLFPFWLASLIFLIFLLVYLNAASLVKSAITAFGTVAAIVLLFQYAFHVPLP